MLKWVLRKVTGKCELLRITYEEGDTIERTKRIEDSLRHSRNSELKTCATSVDFIVEESAKTIASIKSVVPEVHPRFENSLRDCLQRIKTYNKILAEAEELRKEKFSKADPTHEAKLVQLWNVYSDVPLPQSVGQHWTDLGFQGLDPGTDFRGMGMLGLEQLIYFALTYPAEARQVLSQSHHPKYGFSFAIVGINMTEMGYTLLFKGRLRSHFYGLDKPDPDLVDLHQVYCYLLYEFTQFWQSEKPRDIMEFSRLREKFRKNIQKALKAPKVRLLSSFQEVPKH
ncbi:unnamed protein product [Candidula unifasciata]|uniref:ELMO domain-containing protein n=1 Tax=Candidula unifasciata TaxID=100452 RepID=A0A8S4A8D2_9EUPU|nr:unnamed protein product [Candidula unifasciata]